MSDDPTIPLDTVGEGEDQYLLKRLKGRELIDSLNWNGVKPHYFRNSIIAPFLLVVTVVGLVLGTYANQQIHRPFGAYSAITVCAIVVFLFGVIRYV